ncbi:sperm-associated antigen 8-like [Octopus sinensis]|uniref:Sperm-associated antigen 8-like n=1 Tax=Octopus sinensis TaxID=2607531 RepID=A0A6P7TL26_9MOLL|nr:sperm-associated antigen 8-like [Octopus sinensis]
MDTIPLKSSVEVSESRNKCLLKNWFEERRVLELKDENVLPSGIDELRYGHPGIFTLEERAQFSRESTFRGSYKPPCVPKFREQGVRREVLEKMMSKEAYAKIMDDISPKPYQADYKTMTEEYYHRDFVCEAPKPTKPHNFRVEQPVSYWTEMAHKLHGVSMITSKDGVFHKNDAFSTPVNVSLGKQLPYEESHLT